MSCLAGCQICTGVFNGEAIGVGAQFGEGPHTAPEGSCVVASLIVRMMMMEETKKTTMMTHDVTL